MAGMMRPPPPRPAMGRSKTAAPNFSGRISPAESVSSTATGASRARSPNSQTGGAKRKAAEFENDSTAETNINVVVRCRGRNAREVRENSGVVVSTNGVKGNAVELSMGPNAISNKTYHFDKVFSAAADQTIMFEEVVTPVLEEVLSGFNCTIFAYGQTGTGKTYTMSGDSLSDMVPIPDGAGIIPRVLHYLFEKLGSEDVESSVKCSFIELYNEELRDLLSADESTKLKIYDDGARKGTLIQGMEESYIQSAQKGISLLRTGSYKRQVAATKCNELSSRSHTVFTVTVYLKRTTDSGEDYVSAGKLNLVDLAGSENIQRSGAENKRAAEAGLINKSLLTLGRVINALVDKSSHIPYRESKLTRLLQDSLGGRTKTCIIATISPAKSNLEETISTLDYAFRAKNIKNKPQINQTVSKKTLLKEFASEIEKLKGELISTRQRNGVYLSTENYEQLTAENESRRILSEEQRDIISTMEANLRNKVQELYTLTNSFASMKKDNETLQVSVDESKNLLQQTETVLSITKRCLLEESTIRKAHEQTEMELLSLGKEMQDKLLESTSDAEKLHKKLKRKSDLHSSNRGIFDTSRAMVSEKTADVDSVLQSFQAAQHLSLVKLSNRMKTFVQDELQELNKSKAYLQDKVKGFSILQAEVGEQTVKGQEELDNVLEEVKLLRCSVSDRVGNGLDTLSDTAARMSAGVVKQIEALDSQLQSGYAMLGDHVKNSFKSLAEQLNDQKTENERLQRLIIDSNMLLRNSSVSATKTLEISMHSERERAARETADMLAKINTMVNANAEMQQARLESSIANICNDFSEATKVHEKSEESYEEDMDALKRQSEETIANTNRKTEAIESGLLIQQKEVAIYTNDLRDASSKVHRETIDVVSAQKTQLAEQLATLDDIAMRVKAQNDNHHKAHVSSLALLGQNVTASNTSVSDRFDVSYARIQQLDSSTQPEIETLRASVTSLGANAREPLQRLKSNVESQNITEYKPTGDTPEKKNYAVKSNLPTTESRQRLLAKLHTAGEADGGSAKLSPKVAQSPPKNAAVFTDLATDQSSDRPDGRDDATIPPTGSTLCELDVNVMSNSISTSSPTAERELLATKYSADTRSAPQLKRLATTSAIPDLETKLPRKASRKTLGNNILVEGNENIPITNFSSSVGPGIGRRLRSRVLK